MAISVTWPTKVINVPKADLTLIQASPEVRELDLDWFRLILKDLEDDPEGMPFPDTHSHNTEVTLSGLTYARIIEVINGYTIAFEDGQYTVNCTGANHNVADVKVANQVSLIVNNAAGLITNPAIEYSSFNGGVTVDTGGSNTGTAYPTGTPQRPVNNMTDALQIAINRGLTAFFILGDITLDDSLTFDQYSFYGESMGKTVITIEANAGVEKCEFYEASVQGVLDGDTKLKNCLILDVNYISGYVELCVLDGTVVLGGGLHAHFLDCWAGTLKDDPPVIDMGGSGQTLVLQNFNGMIKLINKTGAADEANVSLNAGMVILDATITAGDINIMGVGAREDNSGPGANVDTTFLVSPGSVADSVWANQEAQDLITAVEAVPSEDDIWRYER